MATEREKAINEATAAITLQVAQKNLHTAKLTHKKIVEQLSMRTATVAQIAAQLMTSEAFVNAEAAARRDGKVWGAAGAVKLAEELMEAAEDSAAKAKALQDVVDK